MKMDEITKMTPDTGKRETIKTPFAKIIVGGTAEKPYYMICYYDSADKQFVLCCGSYNIDYVFQWYREDFEIIDNGGFDAVPVVRCKDCGISRKEQSKFTVRQGEIVFEQNGYKKLIEMWNRRYENG